MKFNATARSVQGTSASRRLRRAGRVPAIVYGGAAQPVNVELDHNEIFHALRKPAFASSVLEMDLEGKVETVLLRSVQWHPFKSQVLHIDFQRVSANEKLTTKVPLRVINAEVSPAVKLSSALISQIHTEVEVVCLPKDLPAEIIVDLSNLQGGASVHLNDLVAPAGVSFQAHPNDPNPALVTAIVKGGGAAAGATEEAEG
ncbi:50S ribosomal protein L25/general stress protein Ctc [Corticimicrobacter populi]|uniref:Large ribosomal subunit protein bL25 n=1 Tax=Corticimicrobacter populi TaxID=2175229 RepID=A0A2V1K2X2_9BURK|nr:50S ribosomal protein L25/general stress protein Ctc [Corticimicrobacter populi]PWF22653.1 50S ribosomal protein L25 [Corticimicrobacter populi]